MRTEVVACPGCGEDIEAPAYDLNAGLAAHEPNCPQETLT
jgi:hypothetical protein